MKRAYSHIIMTLIALVLSSFNNIHADKVALPTFSMDENFVVTIQCETLGASIYYHIGSFNYTISECVLYEGSFQLTKASRIYAIAVCEGMENSNWANADYYSGYYLSSPTIYHNLIENNTRKVITFNSNNNGASVYYTIDGSDPNTSGSRKLYDSQKPDTIDHNLTIKAISVKDGYFNSSIAQVFAGNIVSTFYSGSVFYRRVDNVVTNEVEVTSGSLAYKGVVSIPTTVTYKGVTYSVTRIGANAFNNQDELTSVKIASSVTSIGENAFRSCDALTSIVFPGSVRSIEDYAFYNTPLALISFSEGLETIGNYVFGVDNLNNKLKQVSFPSTLISIGNGAFRYRNGLSRIEFNQNLQTIGNNAFFQCQSLESVSLPNSVTSIGSECFRDCSGLLYAKLPSGLETIEELLFCNCNKLKSVVIPNSVQNIKYAAFCGCSQLASVVIPEGVTSIPNQCFYGCSQLSSVSLPSTLISIDQYAFYNCISLTTITIPSAVTTIGQYAYNQCNNIQSMYVFAETPPTLGNRNAIFTMIQGGSTLLYVPAEYMETYLNTTDWQLFGERIVEIGSLPCSQPMFTYDNYTLSMAVDTEGASIYYTDDGAEPTTESNLYTGPINFLRNDTIKAIAVKEGLENSAVTQFIKSDFRTAAPQASILETDEGRFKVSLSCDKPDERLGEVVFCYFTNYEWWMNDHLYDDRFLNQSVKSDSVIELNRPQYIYIKAFREGWSLSDLVTLNYSDNYRLNQPSHTWTSNSRTLELNHATDGVTIYYTLDGSDPNVSSSRKVYSEPITLNRNIQVRAIASLSGHFNSDIDEFTISDVNYQFESNGLWYRFKDYSTAAEVTLVRPSDNGESYSGTITVPSSIKIDNKVDVIDTICLVTSLASGVFRNYTDLNTVKLPATITTIPSQAFEGCTALTDVSIPETITSIGNNAFYGCTALSNDLIFNSGLMSIGDYAFYNTNVGTVRFEAVSTQDNQRLMDWSSGNHSHGSSSENKYEIVAVRDSVLSFDWYVSSESNCDWLRIYLDDEQIVAVSGYQSGQYSHTFTESGRHILTVRYSKDGSASLGDDLGRVSNIKGVTGKSFNNLTVGYYAFYGSKVSTVDISRVDVSINNDAFRNCVKLNNVKLDTRTVGSWFRENANLKEVFFGRNVETIGNDAFYNCDGIKTVTIGDNVNSINYRAFYDCNGIETVNMGNSVISIGNYAFYYCNKLSSIVLSDSLTSIGNYAFQYCTSLQSITLPAAVVSIGDANTIAFYGAGLTSVYVQSALPVTVYRDQFGYDIKNRSVLYVPEGSIDAYTEDDYWKGFSSTVEYSGVAPCAQPVFSFGKYSLTITSQTVGASIYYTRDGSTPTELSLLYTDSIDFLINDTIRAIAIKDDKSDSPISEFRKNDMKVSMPDISFSFDDKQLTIECPSPDYRVKESQIYYQIIDDTNSDNYNHNYWNVEQIKQNCILYTGPVSVERPGNIVAVAIRDGWNKSDWRYLNYYSSYSQSMPEIRWNQSSTKDTVKIIHSDSEAKIFYTLDGSDPNSSDTRKEYTAPFTINRNLVIKAIVEKDGFFSSQTRVYTITDVNSRFQRNGIYYRIVDNTVEDFVEVTAGDNRYSGDIVIPDTVSRGGVSYVVTRIGNSAFSDCNNLTSVSMPKTITGIGSNAFYNCDKITSITFTENVKNVESYAFDNCDGLVEIILNEGLQVIGTGAFRYCRNLPKIILPSTVATIEANGFLGCTKLSNILFGKSLTSIGDDAFNSCTSMAEIELPDTLTQIGLRAFKSCTSLKTVKLPSNIEVLSRDLFDGCSSLNGIVIPPSVKTINRGVFHQNTSLTSIELPDGIEFVAEYLFRYCSSLVSVIIPSSVKEIREYAFGNCTALQNIIIPQGVTNIRTLAFSGCSAMTDVYATPVTPPNVTSDTWYGVSAKAALHLVSDEAVENYENAQYWSDFNSLDKYDGSTPCMQPTFMLDTERYYLSMYTQTKGASIYYTNDNTAPDTSKTRLLYSEPIAFYTNDTILAIAVRDSTIDSPIGRFVRNNFRVAKPVVSISDSMVIKIDVDNPVPVETQVYYKKVDASTYGNSLYWPSDPKDADEIKNSWTLYEGAFRPERAGLLYVYALRDGWLMSEGVKFNYYNNLYLGKPEIQWNQSVTKDTVKIKTSSTAVASSAKIFYTLDGSDPNTSSTRKEYTGPFTINRNLVIKAIREYKGYFNSDITERKITDINSTFQKDGIYYRIIDNIVENYIEVTSGAVKYTGDIVIPDTVSRGGVLYTVTSIGAGAFSECGGLTSVSLPKTLNAFGYKSFYNCDNLTTITFPENVEYVYANAFEECDNLVDIKLNEGLQYIYGSAFRYCRNLPELVLPSTVTEIYSSAFYGCNKLRSITLSEGLISIGASAFAGCSSLITIDMPDNLTSLGTGVFYNCTSLRTVHLSEGLRILPSELFSGCSVLQTIVIPDSIKTINDKVFYNARSLGEITVPEGVSIISDYTFSGCNNLVSVQLPSTLKRINMYAFSSCVNLQSIIIPDSVSYIGDNAFNGCSALRAVYSLNSEPAIIASNTWNGVTSNAVLNVISDDAKNAYENAAYWSSFKSIVKYDGFIPCMQPTFLLDNYTLTMLTQTEGANIYYTYDNSSPDTSTTRILYSEPISFYKNDTIYAIAVKNDMANSPVGTFIRNTFKVAKPAVTISDSLLISVTVDEPVPVETKIYYLKNDVGSNGFTPSFPQSAKNSDEVVQKWSLFDGLFRPQKAGRMTVVAIRDGWLMSDYVQFDYTGRHLAAPGINYNQNKKAVILNHSLQDVKIYYTLDGTDPTIDWSTQYTDSVVKYDYKIDDRLGESAKLYTDTIWLTENSTVRAVATLDKRFDSYVATQSFNWYKVATPKISFSAITTTITCDSEYDTIYYTVDGSTPTRYSMVYKEPFSLSKIAIDSVTGRSNNVTIKALGIKKNWTDSSVGSEYYSVSSHTCQTPRIVNNHNEYDHKTDSTVIITTATENAIIYYTMDGSTPTTESMVYSEPIKINQNGTIKAIATRNDMLQSPVQSYNITWVKLHQPIISFNGKYVTITQDIPGSTIYYTIDESDPTDPNLTRKKYIGPFSLNSSTIVRAYAECENFIQSEVTSRQYTTEGNYCATPVIARRVNTDLIQINTTTDGASIYYTTNGLAPTINDSLYKEPFSVDYNLTVRAIAVKETSYDSEVGIFEVSWFTVPRPVITVDGKYVTMSCAKEGSEIYYTLDGSDPTIDDHLYTGQLTMDDDCTIKACGFYTNWNDSQFAKYSFSRKASTVGTPSISRVKESNTVKISVTPVNGTSVYYSLDGTIPDTLSTMYTEPIELDENCTVNAYGVNGKLFDSELGSLKVEWFKVATPTFTYDEEKSMLSMESATTKAVIHYSFNEKLPVSEWITYTEPIQLTDNKAVYAYATRSNYNDSETDFFTPGTFVCTNVSFEYDGRYLNMKTNTGATIRYTIDGSQPNSASTAYIGPVEIKSVGTVKAVSQMDNFKDSEITTFSVTYLFDGDKADFSEPGHMQEAMAWMDKNVSVTSLPVKGEINNEDLAFIKSLTSVEHLDLSEATIVGSVLPDDAFGGMNIISFSSPKDITSVPEHLFRGNKKLAAIEWNANVAIPQTVLNDVTNPNMLLYVNARQYAPSSYTGNLISGGEATEIVLNDTESSGDFYCPKRFFAKTISYTHEFIQPTVVDSTQGWETLALPFDVKTITHETRGQLAPFAKGLDKAQYKPFWLCELSSTGFTRASEIKAYTPYIISMPNNPIYADDYILSGKVTFTSEEIYVEADQNNVTEKGAVSFTPSMQRISPNPNIMNINLTECVDKDGKYHATGSAFISGLRESKPFEAYAVINSSPAAVHIRELMEQITTEILATFANELKFGGAPMLNGTYDMNGRKLSNDEVDYLKIEGNKSNQMLIINGKKVLIK